MSRSKLCFLLPIVFAFALLFALTPDTASGAEKSKGSNIAHLDMSKFLDCLDDKESSNGKRAHIDGDGGTSIGHFQIQEAYWKDATTFDPSIGGTYQDCRKREYAARIVIAYMSRYAPPNATYEHLARLHQGGPSAIKRKSKVNTAYWRSTAFDPLRL